MRTRCSPHPATRLAWRAFAIASALGALVADAAFVAAFDRKAWQAGWPHFAGAHRGCLVLLSSLWDWPPPYLTAHAPCATTYDVFVTPPPRWRPSYARVGTRYSTGPVPWGRPMQGVFVPLWIVSLAGAGAVAIAWRPCRFGRRPGTCRSCGYSLAGLDSTARCPECARPSPGNRPQ